jgi:programmed cell death 8 (apoptosis-inducing factor)
MMMGGGRLFRSLYRPLIRPNISRSSSSSAGGTPSSIRYLTGAGAIVGGIVTYSYWYHWTNESPHVGIKVDYGSNNKIQQYEMEGSVHPEAEAEENLVPTTENVPAITKAEIDEDHGVPEFAPYVLIGGGTASFAAAKAIREKDPSAKVLIIGDEDYTPYSRPPLSKQLWYYEDHSAAKELRFTASWSRGKEVDVFYKMDFCPVNELMERDGGGVAIVTRRKVISLNPQAKKMILDDKREVKYNKCLLATGGRPRTLPIFDDSKFTGRVTTFRDIPDYKTLDGIVDKVGSVLVIGGGFLGSELAVGMRNRGRSKDINVIQLFPESGNLGLVLPKDVSQWTTNKVKAEGITVMSDVTVREAGLDDGGRITITASDGQQVSVDHVVVAVGLQPNDELAKSGHLEIDGVYGGIKVNSELQACTDVWAVSDSKCIKN